MPQSSNSTDRRLNLLFDWGCQESSPVCASGARGSDSWQDLGADPSPLCALRAREGDEGKLRSLANAQPPSLIRRRGERGSVPPLVLL